MRFFDTRKIVRIAVAVAAGVVFAVTGFHGSHGAPAKADITVPTSTTTTAPASAPRDPDRVRSTCASCPA